MKNKSLLINALAISTVLIGSMASMPANAAVACTDEEEALGGGCPDAIPTPKLTFPKAAVAPVAPVAKPAAVAPVAAAPAAVVGPKPSTPPVPQPVKVIVNVYSDGIYTVGMQTADGNTIYPIENGGMHFVGIHGNTITYGSGGHTIIYGSGGNAPIRFNGQPLANGIPVEVKNQE